MRKMAMGVGLMGLVLGIAWVAWPSTETPTVTPSQAESARPQRRSTPQADSRPSPTVEATPSPKRSEREATLNDFGAKAEAIVVECYLPPDAVDGHILQVQRGPTSKGGTQRQNADGTKRWTVSWDATSTGYATCTWVEQEVAEVTLTGLTTTLFGCGGSIVHVEMAGEPVPVAVDETPCSLRSDTEVAEVPRMTVGESRTVQVRAKRDEDAPPAAEVVALPKGGAIRINADGEIVEPPSVDNPATEEEVEELLDRSDDGDPFYEQAIHVIDDLLTVTSGPEEDALNTLRAQLVELEMHGDDHVEALLDASIESMEPVAD